MQTSAKESTNLNNKRKIQRKIRRKGESYIFFGENEIVMENDWAVISCHLHTSYIHILV